MQVRGIAEVDVVPLFVSRIKHYNFDKHVAGASSSATAIATHNNWIATPYSGYIRQP
jgi:hypothetical protein